MGGALTWNGHPAGFVGRVAVWGLLIGGWLVAVWYMRDALATLPSAERLEASRLVAIPTVRTFWTAALFSALELAIILALLWPWSRAFYASRLALTVLALVTWFVMTTPMDITRMDWVHRRWLLGMAAGLAVALAALLLIRLGRLGWRWQAGSPSPPDQP